jgi:hypothetical protein
MQLLIRSLAAYWDRVQTTLFPYLAAVDVPLTPQLERLVAILDLLRIEEAVPRRTRATVGAPSKDRAALARALVAKHFLNLPDTKALRLRLRGDAVLCRICGWATPAAVPSEATFSRAFARFADLAILDTVHAQRVTDWLGETLVWHQALDATDIAARERPQPNPAPQYGRTATGHRAAGDSHGL